MAKGKGKQSKFAKFNDEPSQYTKTDMQRIGLFKEMRYVSVGDRYRSPGQSASNTVEADNYHTFPIIYHQMTIDPRNGSDGWTITLLESDK